LELFYIYALYRPAANMYAANGPTMLGEYNNISTASRQTDYSEPRSAPGPSPNLSHRPLQPQTQANFDDRYATTRQGGTWTRNGKLVLMNWKQ